MVSVLRTVAIPYIYCVLIRHLLSAEYKKAFSKYLMKKIFFWLSEVECLLHEIFLWLVSYNQHARMVKSPGCILESPEKFLKPPYDLC